MSSFVLVLSRPSLFKDIYEYSPDVVPALQLVCREVRGAALCVKPPCQCRLKILRTLCDGVVTEPSPPTSRVWTFRTRGQRWAGSYTSEKFLAYRPLVVTVEVPTRFDFNHLFLIGKLRVKCVACRMHGDTPSRWYGCRRQFGRFREQDAKHVYVCMDCMMSWVVQPMCRRALLRC